ncbi:hypothetical protein Q9L58_010368, partial [Maublancomyces gigas]
MSKGTTHRKEITTSYLDDEILLQVAKTPEFACTNLQSRLNRRGERALSLNIRFSPAKSELMHMLPRQPLGAQHKQRIET